MEQVKRYIKIYPLILSPNLPIPPQNKCSFTFPRVKNLIRIKNLKNHYYKLPIKRDKKFYQIKFCINKTLLLIYVYFNVEMFPYDRLQSCSAKSAIRSKFVADTWQRSARVPCKSGVKRKATISLTFILGYHWSRACH